jgi:protein gp37
LFVVGGVAGRATRPFFFKQWGGVRKKKAGRLLDGRTYDEMPVIGSPETLDKLVATN